MSDFGFLFWLLTRWSPVSAVDLTIPARWAWWFNRSMRCTPFVRLSLLWKETKKKGFGGAMCSESYRTQRRCWVVLVASVMLAATVPYHGQPGRVRRQCGSLGVGRAGGNDAPANRGWRPR